MSIASPDFSQPLRRFWRAASLAFMMPLAACSLLPSAGPDRGDIDQQRTQAEQPAFTLIDLGSASLGTETPQPQDGFAARFGGSDKPPPLVIAVGDGVAVEVWEVGTDTLFSSRTMTAGLAATSGSSARNTNLQEQIVGADGTLHLPFAGRVAVLGRTAIEVEQLLTQALAGKASRPQIIVQLRKHSGRVTVAGDVAGGSRVPLSVQGERLLDVLSTAGGVRAPIHETRIQLTRGSESVSLPLLRVLQDPRENIYLEPGDLLVATRQTQSFTAFGATGRNAQIEFGAERVSLIEAVAKTGGLLDSRADPRGVYLLRYEPRAVVDGLRVVPLGGAPEVQDEVRVVYRLDLAQVGSYFVAQRFAMRDRDILYVSSAATNELQKFLELVGLVSQPLIQGAVVRGALK